MTPADVAKQYFQDYEYRKLMRRRSEDQEKRLSVDGQRRHKCSSTSQTLSANNTPVSVGMGEEALAPLGNRAQLHQQSSLRKLEFEDQSFSPRARSQHSNLFAQDSGLLNIPECSLLSKMGVDVEARGLFKNLSHSVFDSDPRRSMDSSLQDARRKSGQQRPSLDANSQASHGWSQSNSATFNDPRRSVDSLVHASRRKGLPLNNAGEHRNGTFHNVEVERMSVDSKGRFHNLGPSNSFNSAGRSTSCMSDFAANEEGSAMYARYEPCKPEANAVSPIRASLAADEPKVLSPPVRYAFTQMASFRVLIVVAILVALLLIS
eukprot:gene7984-1204_t